MSRAQTQPEATCPPHWFATTHWSVVLNAADSLAPGAESALEDLCRGYWTPLYSYVRRRGYDEETARDLTQEFFAQLLAKRLLRGVDPTKGKFRSWLLGVLKHFLAHEWTKTRAQKRGGGQMVLSLDELDAENQYLAEAPGESSPELMFDRRWACAVLEHAASRLREEYEAAGKTELYSVLKGFVAAEGASVEYEKTSEWLGMSASGVKSAIYRFRQRYQQCIREEIAQTVSTSSQVDEEIRYLVSVLRS